MNALHVYGSFTRLRFDCPVDCHFFVRTTRFATLSAELLQDFSRKSRSRCHPLRGRIHPPRRTRRHPDRHFLWNRGGPVQSGGRRSDLSRQGTPGNPRASDPCQYHVAGRVPRARCPLHVPQTRRQILAGPFDLAGRGLHWGSAQGDGPHGQCRAALAEIRDRGCAHRPGEGAHHRHQRKYFRPARVRHRRSTFWNKWEIACR